MADATRPGALTYQDHEAQERAARWTPAYLRRLLIERHHIRSALVNPGGSIILMGVAATIENPTAFSSVVGNDFHLDLVEAESVLAELPTETRLALLAWADGLSSRQAAEYFGVRPSALRKRRERAVSAVVEEITGATTPPTLDGGESNLDAAPLGSTPSGPDGPVD